MCQHLSEKKRELTVKVQEEEVGRGRHRRRSRVVPASIDVVSITRSRI